MSRQDQVAWAFNVCPPRLAVDIERACIPPVHVFGKVPGYPPFPSSLVSSSPPRARSLVFPPAPSRSAFPRSPSELRAAAPSTARGRAI